jgi:ferric-dicitrate binding protein FerR (iron transport regulator)
MDNQCSREELEELYASIDNPEVAGLLDEEFAVTKESATDVNWDRMFNRIVQRKKPAYWKYAVAAMILVLLSVYLQHTKTPAKVQIAQLSDLAPGRNKATLTLADGSAITLDSADRVMQQGSTAIHQKNGQLQYSNQGVDVVYNTLTTPRGGQYQLTLPDGTKVWLNAASSLKFPVAFTGKQREVTLTGEAYFEVVHNEQMPFKVQVAGMVIEDLGTHFNIMAYADEAMVKTTLLEGAVSVSDGNKNVRLKPGQQTVGMKVQQADTDEAIAWKNGEFSFHHTSIYEVMRQVSRWYDVDISYKDSLDTYLSGNIKRSENVSAIFKMLELAGDIKLKIDNRKVSVMK